MAGRCRPRCIVQRQTAESGAERLGVAVDDGHHAPGLRPARQKPQQALGHQRQVAGEDDHPVAVAPSSQGTPPGHEGAQRPLSPRFLAHDRQPRPAGADLEGRRGDERQASTDPVGTGHPFDDDGGLVPAHAAARSTGQHQAGHPGNGS